MGEKLTGIPETLLITLWARAVEAQKAKPIIHDTAALEIMSQIDYDFDKFTPGWRSQVGVAVRSELFDNQVKAFVSHNPNAVVINLGAGLDTRYTRMQSNLITWYDLDVPEVISLRKKYFEETDNYRMIAGSVFDFSWMDEIKEQERPILFIAEGLFMYFEEPELRKLFAALIERFPNSEMLFEMLCPFMVGRGHMHDTVKLTDSVPDFKFGLKNAKEVENWQPGIEYLNEWNYFDFHKDRWNFFGTIMRLPFWRKNFATRLVHIRFNGERVVH